ncbi:KipI family sensor histidine kinase inhibitor [Cellulomonas sp. SLBN-39]|nr:KipI family sensor histidine kinase inhibitor [Cellulomonas sp. SLBN-39]
MTGPGPDGAPVVRPYGADAVLVDLPDLRAVRAVDAALRTAAPAGVLDVVPAARTVLVRGAADRRAAWAARVATLARDTAGPGTRPLDDAADADGVPDAVPPRTVEVPVVYDGPDLDEVAALTGLAVEEVVARHLAGGPGGYRVAFGGFMPGFAYVVGVDPALQVPRRSSPRTRVPAGSVAVAGEFTAVYPGPTPGGWRLIGTSPEPVFDVTRGRDGAALLAPGDAVRFVRRRPAAVVAAPAPGATTGHAPVPADAPAPGRQGTDGPATDGPAPAGPGGDAPALLPLALTVVRPGPLVLVEDLGRPGLAAVGVPRSGAADPAALAHANRLVGNATSAAGLEVLLGGLVVTFGGSTAFALTGAQTDAHLDGVPVPHGVAVRAPAGATLALGAPARGLRTWLAVRGGVDATPVLGSRAHDQLSGLGPAPVRAGDLLAYGTCFDGLPAVADPGTSPPAPARRGPGRTVLLAATTGPRLGHLAPAAQDALWRRTWTVAPESNRVAVRLDGDPLTLAGHGELPSEGLVPGAVQVPHDGRPVVFGADHPVTGGYPVVAVLTPRACARAAQLRPGEHVRIVPAVGT